MAIVLTSTTHTHILTAALRSVLDTLVHPNFWNLLKISRNPFILCKWLRIGSAFFRIYSSFLSRSIFGRTCSEFQSKYLQWNCTGARKGQGWGAWPQLFTKLLLFDLFFGKGESREKQREINELAMQTARDTQILRDTETCRYFGILRPADTLGYLVKIARAMLNHLTKQTDHRRRLKDTMPAEYGLQLLDNIIQ